MDSPVILCGLGRVGRRVLEYLRAAAMPVVVVDTKCAPKDPRLQGVRLVRGDCRLPEVLEEAGLSNARGVLILTSDDLVNISAALTVRHLNPEVRIVVRMFSPNLLGRLGKAVSNVYALSVSALTAPVLALTALTGSALGAFGQDDMQRQVIEVIVGDGPLQPGQPIEAAEARWHFLAVAHLSVRGGERFLHEVDRSLVLERGDRLILCGKPEELAPLAGRDTEADSPNRPWAGWLRRNARVLGRTFAEVDLPVKICTAVLAIVILGSTLVYHLGINKTLPDGLYRTISVMATGSDMHEDELPVGWQKVFVSFLRIFGAAVTAAFTAIVTNYLIRARLGTALELRRIPDGGHVVVCGLGNVGFRVAEDLIRRDERVVVIERAPDGRFVGTARRLGVAVITGDATVPEVLRQAHADSARAVLAVTDNELANLEIALLSRELNPQQRVVVRLADAQLAQTLREAANVSLALSISTLAAPAFVAALLGDRVQNILLIHGRVLAAIELRVQADDNTFAGQTMRALAVDYRLLPVALRPEGQTRVARPADYRLRPGDRVAALVALPDLARLLRRERAPADWAVQVTGFPLPARSWVGQILRMYQEMSAADAEKALEKLPIGLGGNFTRGQAEDLLALCRREKVTAELRRTERE